MKEHLDLIVVGAGPSGLACAIEAKKRKLKFWVLEKGCVVHSIYRYPTNMIFFTTADLLEVGDIPMIVSAEKPSRLDGLKYYRRVVEHYDLPIRDYEPVLSVTGRNGDFRVLSRDRLEQEREYSCSKVVVATGYYDNPNFLDVPGEDLDKVSQIVKVFGMVNCTPEFVDHPKVINGCSDLLVEVFGDKGRHARAAVGVASVPFGSPVSIDMVVEVED